ncbi:MAG: acyl carrier protein [Deltaproteobacteria bacterium]|jgi:acyl carrier protein
MSTATSHEPLTSRLLDLAAAKFSRPRASLSPEQDLFDALEIDSVDAMTLLTALESEFRIEIPDYEIQDVRTFAALADVIARRL